MLSSSSLQLTKDDVGALKAGVFEGGSHVRQRVEVVIYGAEACAENALQKPVGTMRVRSLLLAASRTLPHQ